VERFQLKKLIHDIRDAEAALPEKCSRKSVQGMREGLEIHFCSCIRHGLLLGIPRHFDAKRSVDCTDPIVYIPTVRDPRYANLTVDWFVGGSWCDPARIPYRHRCQILLHWTPSRSPAHASLCARPGLAYASHAPKGVMKAL
jgi:hypothetical protein